MARAAHGAALSCTLSGRRILAVIAAGVFQLFIPLYLGAAIDQALGLVSGAKTGGATATQAQSALVTSALLVLGIAVMRGVFTLAHNYLAESIGQSFGYELRLAFFEKLQRLSFSLPYALQAAVMPRQCAQRT